MVFDASLLNTQYHKVRIKVKVEQSRERSSAPPTHLGGAAIKKGAFGSPSTTVTNFINAIRNANRLVQDLNTGHRIHFQRQ